MPNQHTGPVSHRERIALFRAKVNKLGPKQPHMATRCWVWTGSISNKGYGQFFFRGSLWLAHRVSWVLARGEIPEGLFTLHHCDHPPCVRPSHLFLGTNADNVADMHAKGRGTNFLGENSPCAKLTSKEVAEIKMRREQGELCRTIAEDFGITRQYVGQIARGQYRETG